MILGGDYSLYDNVLDWANHNWKYAFIKVSEGTVEDPMFKLQWNAARGYVYRGAYHFLRPLVPWKSSADKLLAILNREGKGELPPVLDMEVINGVAKTKVCEDALEWLGYVHRNLGKKPIIYTSRNFANTLAEMWKYVDFADYGLWQAEYPWDTIDADWSEEQRAETIHKVITGEQRYIFPVTPRPWQDAGRQALFVQWTGKCLPIYVPGYPLGHKEAVDVNFYRYSLDEMKVRFNLPDLEQGDDDMSSKPTTWTASLRSGLTMRIRSGAGTEHAIKETITAPATQSLGIKGTGTKLGPFLDGSTGNSYYWGEVIEVNGVPKAGFVAFTTSITNVVWLETPIPPTEPAQRKIVKQVAHFDDGTTVETFPENA